MHTVATPGVDVPFSVAVDAIGDTRRGVGEKLAVRECAVFVDVVAVDRGGEAEVVAVEA